MHSLLNPVRALRALGGFTMPPMLTKRQSTPILPILVLLLCGSVFAWGFHTRLTRFMAPDGFHAARNPHLFQDNQPNRKTGTLEPCNNRIRPRFLSAEGISPFQIRFVLYWRLNAGRPDPAFIPPYPHALYFRPPPASV